MLGNRVSVGDFIMFYSRSSITVGDNSMIAPFTYIIDSDHGMDTYSPMRDQPMITIPVYIGSDVWIGTGCTIARGSSIGDGAVVGANSFVNGEVMSGTLVAGSPARVIRARFRTEAVK